MIMSAVVTRPFSVAIQSTGFRELINRTLSDENRSKRFIATITSAVATNHALQTCEPGSILSAALTGEALNLSPSPQLGQFYLVPFKKKGRNGEPDTVTAQFQIGYKGYIQLAIRSGAYKKLTVLAIKEGELRHFDPLNEEIDVDLIEDEVEREQARTTGYYAMFEYLNGFRKAIYWSHNKMMAHADKYSQAFNATDYEKLLAGEIPKADMWKYSSFWYKNFDDMALKTVIRQLISKWGVMSTEMQMAYEKDMGVINADGTPNYVDNEPEPQPLIKTPKAAQPASDDSEALPKETSNDRPVVTEAMIKTLKGELRFKEITLVDACEGAGISVPNSIEELGVDAFNAVSEWVAAK
jgi:recombination protein RecT